MQNPWGGYGPPPGTYQPLGVMPGQIPAAQPTQQDLDQLKSLGIGTLVYAIFVGLLSLFGLIYVAIGIAMAADPGSDPDAEMAGGIVAMIGLVFCGIFFSKCVLLIFSAIGLFKRKWRMVSYIGAALSIMNMPIGTVLGIFTFLVLGRPSVKALYDANSSS